VYDAIATFAEGPKIFKNERKFADLRFSELICKPPTFAFATIRERNADVFRCEFTIYNKV
jgi:hypothetical protein